MPRKTKEDISWIRRNAVRIILFVIIPIVTGIVSSAIVLWWQYIHTPTPSMVIIFSPGTEYTNLPMEYKNFYVTITNNGTAQANYLTFFITTPESVNGDYLEWGMYIHNVSIRKSAYSCEAELTHNNSIQVAVSNFGPYQSCEIEVNISLITSGLNKYNITANYSGNYTNLEDYFNQNYTRMFSVTTPVSDSKICYIFYSQQPIDTAIPIASGLTSATGPVNITIHRGVLEQKEACK